MRVLKQNVKVVDPDGVKVVLHGGEVLPEWARVPGSLTRVVDGPDPEPVREVEAFGLPDGVEEYELTIEADEPRWYGDVDGS